MKITLPHQVETVLNILAGEGFKAYIVGGSVRDCIMGKTPFDWDITTQAKPAEIAQTFKKHKVIETGIKHGTLTVVLDGLSMEITTFRIDGEYTDNRRPDSVKFTTDLMQDLSRRDFTINALAYSPQEGIVDGFGGCEDIKNNIIRCVGSPNVRFGEDALRILRALRFASVLDFDIESETAESLLANRNLLKNVAAERKQSELLKLLCGKAVERVLLDYRDVIFEIIPELSATSGFDLHDDEMQFIDIYEHTANSVSLIENEPELRVTMLLHDSGKPACFTPEKELSGSCHGNYRGSFLGHAGAGEEIALAVLKRLRFSKRFAQEVAQLIHYQDSPVFEDPKTLKKSMTKLGEAFFKKLLLVKRADLRAYSPAKFDRIALVDVLEAQMNRLLEQDFCFSIQDLKINGGDLMALGMPAGRAIGTMLERLFDAVIEEKIINEKNALIVAAKELMEKSKHK